MTLPGPPSLLSTVGFCFPSSEYTSTFISTVSSVLGSIYAYVCVLSHFSHVQLYATLWTLAHQAPLSMEFSQARIPSGKFWCHLLFQEIFLIQESNLHPLCLLNWQSGYLALAPPGNLHWCTYMFSISLLIRDSRNSYYIQLQVFPLTPLTPTTIKYGHK